MSDLDRNVKQVFELLLPKIQLRQQDSSRPIILGITGLQGSGKTTWASKIVELLTDHQVHASTLSLDDLYKTHDALIAQRDADPGNRLYRTRGQPGTHDEKLAANFFKALRTFQGGELQVPSFDKSRFDGEGDRAPVSTWPILRSKPDVVVFEGWCIGFQPLPPSAIETAQQRSQRRTVQKPTETSDDEEKFPIDTLANHKLEHLLEVNTNLGRYSESFMGPEHVDFVLHIDTDNLGNVYTWRMQQEHKMIEAKGSGMTDEQVVEFIKGYMPGYELYLDTLRKGFFTEKGRQIRVVLGRDRSIERVEEL